MNERFELANAVITTMCELNNNFPTLVFPDIKPSNFLVVSAVTGGRAAPRNVVLTDLGCVREAGQPVLLGSWPYQQCERGAGSRHEFERFATLITLLQIMLDTPSGDELLQWGKPGGPTLMDKIREFTVLRPELEDGQVGGQSDILPVSSRLFPALTEVSVRNQALRADQEASLEYVAVSHSLPSAILLPLAHSLLTCPTTGAYASSTTRGPTPGVTTKKDAMIGGKKVNRNSWQEEAGSTLQNYIDALEKMDEFNTFQGIEAVSTSVVAHLKQIRSSVGAPGFSMNRKAMLSEARDLAEALLIHMLRRRHAGGNVPRKRGDGAKLNATYVNGKAWFHERKSEIWRRSNPIRLGLRIAIFGLLDGTLFRATLIASST